MAIEYIFGDQKEDALFSSDEKAYVLNKVLLNFDSLIQKTFLRSDCNRNRILKELKDYNFRYSIDQHVNPHYFHILQDMTLPKGFILWEAFSDLLVTSGLWIYECSYSGICKWRGFGFGRSSFPWLWEENGGTNLCGLSKNMTLGVRGLC